MGGIDQQYTLRSERVENIDYYVISGSLANIVNLQ